MVQGIGTNQVELHAGDAVVANGDHFGAITPIPVARVASDWRSGWTEVAAEPLEQVVQQLQRYSDKTLSIATPTDAKKLVSGRFKLDTPVKTLSILASLHQLETIESEDQIILSAATAE